MDALIERHPMLAIAALTAAPPIAILATLFTLAVA